MTNQHVKNENSVINSYRDKERKPCGISTDRFLQVTLVTLTFDTVITKSIEIMASPTPISKTKYERSVIKCSQDNERKPFFHF